MSEKYSHMSLWLENEPDSVILIPYEKEMAFFNELSNGNEDFLEDSLRREPFYTSAAAGFGVLSQDPVRNAKYHFYGTATLAARYCVQKGMGHHHALDLVSYYSCSATRFLRNADRINEKNEAGKITPQPRSF